MSNKKLHELAAKANLLPLLPGVYIMLNSEGEVIYVGKAKKLKNRVSSYFHGEHLPKVEAMVEKVDDFNVIVASSEFEALVLENSLIKKHKPHYNILLKDDKGYPFIVVDGFNEYPRIKVSSSHKGGKYRHYGPFGSRRDSFDIIDSLNKALQLPDCSRIFPRDIGKERPCINYQIGKCAGWCRPEAKHDDYLKAVSQAEMILSGKTEQLISQLTDEMMTASDELRFERAAEVRDRINTIKKLSVKQRVLNTAFSDTDAIGFARDDRVCFSVLHFVNGTLAGKEISIIENTPAEDEELLSEFTVLYYSRHKGSWPANIILQHEPEDISSLEQYLSELAGKRIHIIVPVKGDKKRLSESAVVNAREELKRRRTENQHRSYTLEWLADSLGLPDIPRRIEAFDISNLGDTDIVAGMTVFCDGKPKKSDYRRYKLTEVEAQNDYQSMDVVITRRYRHLLENGYDRSLIPGLVLIDGGAEHATVAVEALKRMGIKLNVFGMVKDDRHRTRALITPEGKEIGISTNQTVFSFIGTIQEETHNTAIGYQRKLRSDRINTHLTQIKGIGPERSKKLIKTFGSLKDVKEAGLEQLKAVLPNDAAESIYDYFHNGNGEEQ